VVYLLLFLLGVLAAIVYVRFWKPWRWWLHRVKAWCAFHNIWWERYRSPRRDELCAYNPPTSDFWDTGRWGFKWTREFTYWWVNQSPVQRWVRAYLSWGWDLWRGRGHPLETWWWRLFRASLNWTNWYSGGNRWEWKWQPRTCSYDGGVHPEDAIRLLREGWVLEGTTKGYKSYMHPPPSSYKTFEEAYPHVYAHQLCKEHQAGHKGERIPVYPWSPVPPVKLYVQHFTEEQIRRVNAVAAAQRQREREDAYTQAMNAIVRNPEGQSTS
jgi:hypothetical protein